METILYPDGYSVNYRSRMPEKWDAEPFRAWLNAQLVRREWTMADLARHLETPNATVARWMSGDRRPSPESCDKLADALRVDVDRVLVLAGHRPDIEAIPVDDRATTLMSMLRRVDLDQPERYETLYQLLDHMLNRDRERAR
jgi:transcriptional regulator with XRE-family HTH domain